MKIVSLNVRGFGSGKESKFGWVKGICHKERPSILALQETKCNLIKDSWVFSLWGLAGCDYIQKPKEGKSGGQIMIWDIRVFKVTASLIGEFFIAIRDKLFMDIKDDVSWVLCGDFNEVRHESKRFNCEFIGSRAKRFNEFIGRNQLLDVPLGGRRFTHISNDGVKMSKIDRFLISVNFSQLWVDLSATAMDRDRSDHCPIILQDKVIDFGPKPFKIFDDWLYMDGVNSVIEQAWNEDISGNRKDCIFRNKLKRVKSALREWSKTHLGSLDMEIELLKKTSTDWELKTELGGLSESEHHKWLESRRKWMEKDKIKTNMLKQKARIKWVTEGDENKKKIHATIR
ncbi:uncharacterized protein [Rutidosis leptorrhynchoides]|uniref:uncharacterized protein n=1 Tax=Rutidosis leptorrhynchoides TaxID=125765 RepID=UPI003A99F9E7